MVWPDGQVQVTVQALIAELPAVTVTVLWKPPVQLLSMCQLAEQVLDPPVGGGVGLLVGGGVAVGRGVGLLVGGGVAVGRGVGLLVGGGVAVGRGVGLLVGGGVAVAGGGVGPPAAVQLRAGVTALPFNCMPKVMLPPAPRAPL